MPNPASPPRLTPFHAIIRDLVTGPIEALTLRHLDVLLTCYTTAGPHTVRGMAGEMEVPKSAVTRALDKLEALDLAVRKPDPTDRRSVVVHQTTAGRRFLARL